MNNISIFCIYSFAYIYVFEVCRKCAKSINLNFIALFYFCRDYIDKRIDDIFNIFFLKLFCIIIPDFIYYFRFFYKSSSPINKFSCLPIASLRINKIIWGEPT